MIDWLDSQAPGQLFTTSITEAEILFGISILPVGKKRHQLQERARHLFEKLLSDRVLPFDSKAAHVYAEFAAFRRSIGRPSSPADAQICAIALINGGSIATRNVTDFDGSGLKLLNPWTD